MHALCARIRAQRPVWLRDLVAAYASVGVFFDPLRPEMKAVAEWLRTQFDALPSDAQATTAVARTVEIPVVYGGGRKVNMVEQVLDVPSQDVITKENAVVRVDGVVFFQVLDAA